MSKNTSKNLKLYILEKIKSGRYPVGSQLPGLRVLANELDVHPNTVSKLYRELSREGILRVEQGRGTFVVRASGEKHDNLEDTIQQKVNYLCENAKQWGFTEEEWLDAATSAARQIYESNPFKLIFVECNTEDTSELAQYLSTLTRLQVDSCLVDYARENIDSIAKDYDIVVTTPFHIDEVELIARGRIETIAVNIIPTTDTLIQLARIPKDARVAAVSLNPQTLERFTKFVRMYTRRNPVVRCLIDDIDTSENLNKAEFIVDSNSIHEQVEKMVNEKKNIVTVKYQIEPNSLEYVRECINLIKNETSKREMDYNPNDLVSA